MPIYEYECGRCRKRFELRQGFHEDSDTECPKCQGKARRVFYPTAVVFKGSGFYITDSRKNTMETKETKETKAKKETAATES